MEGDKELPQTNIDKKAKEAIDNELANFLKPKSEQKTIVGAETVGSVEALMKKPDTAAVDTPLQKEISGQTLPANTKKPIIRTYKSDMEESIQEGHLSSINIAVSENKKLLNQTTADIPEGKKFKINKNILIIAIVLLVGGILTFMIPYLLVQNEAQNIPQPISTNISHALITVDTSETINIATINLNTVATILQEHVQQSATSLGQIKDIVLTEGSGVNQQNITSDDFLKLIQAHIPKSLEQTLEPEYMFGMHNFAGNQEFLILKVSEYDTAFSGMLSWEDNLWQDFKPLFNLPDDAPTPINTNTSASTSPTSSTGTNPFGADVTNPFVVEVKQFQDASFDNKDCRVVRDASGKVIFLYSIVDNNTIVITTSTDTLKEIISRLQQANVSTQ
jgi:hypothetical protein